MKNKEYEYDKKSIWVDSDIHKELKELAVYESISMGDMIHKAITKYKKYS